MHAGDPGAQLVWSGAVGVQGILPGSLWQVLVVTSTKRDPVGGWKLSRSYVPIVVTFSLPPASDSMGGYV